MNNRKASKELLVGVDVGGTKVAVLVVDRHYDVRSQTTLPTDLDSPQSTLRGIVEAVRQGVGRAEARMSDVAAVGLGCPGRVDPQTGIVRRAVNLGWEELPLGNLLSAQLRVPCLLKTMSASRRSVSSAIWARAHRRIWLM